MICMVDTKARFEPSWLELNCQLDSIGNSLDGVSIKIKVQMQIHKPYH